MIISNMFLNNLFNESEANLFDQPFQKSETGGGYMFPISRWKLLTEEERRLAKIADNSYEGKLAYVNYYKENDSAYYIKGLEFIEKSINNFVKKELSLKEREDLTVDMVYSLHRFGCTFNEYFLFDFPKLNAKGRSEFICDKVRFYLYSLLNLESNHKIFYDKANTYSAFSKFYGRKVIKIETDNDFKLFSDFVAEFDKFIVKPLDKCRGYGIKKFNKADYVSEAELFNKIRSNGPVVLEELIKQDAEMAKFHPQSVNTVRMPVVKSKDQTKVTVFHPVLRTGRSDSIVDNAGAGGVIANVDAETGVVYTAGVDEFGNEYIFHPDSGCKIVGFQIPRWSEAVNLVKELSKHTTNRYIGWDLALTEKGWVVVEGNAYGEFIMQFPDKVGRLKELIALINE